MIAGFRNTALRRALTSSALASCGTAKTGLAKSQFLRGIVSATNAGGTQSATGVIKHDHRELEDYYNRIISTNDPDEQARYQNLFVWELARHSIGEELVVYPAFEKFLPSGEQMATKDRKEHQLVKEKLYEFQNLKPGDARFATTLLALFKDLKQHMKEEEEEDLVPLEGAIEDGHSEKLARSFERTKMFVPTRSHPRAPDKPPFETVAGLMTAPLDKVRDMFTKFPID
ncbi:hypothetical protein PCL_08597 [Purpureocillium lilacinum]|uniref:Hemerythrin-like domain-containing protein n=1 Tax=Purpureocillium lilacinum TaxID=33203 RepID=A0A2U3DR58_PURLI|nr:hypothetical protein PCL_08597 [Purpureocillium lilacinum]